MERIELARLLGADHRQVARRKVIVTARDPGAFMAELGDAVAGGGTVFVADPGWRRTEWRQFARLTAPGVPRLKLRARGRACSERGWLCLPTGGSSGSLRLARHDQDTIAAAVGGFRAHFGIERVNAVGVLPLHHVSGLMAWMRCALSGGRYQSWAWAELAAGRWPRLGRGEWFLSLVPTQLQRLLERPGTVERLKRFHAVLLGGGPAWPELLERAAAARLPLAPGYGSTETAAMVAALRPAEFLAGRIGCGRALPHARVTLDGRGVIQVAGPSVFLGYFPRTRPALPWSTDDLGRFDARGSLQVLGRRDAAIITGGKKVDPAQVEAGLRATGAFADVAVVGLPDPEWGEVVTACYPGGGSRPDLAEVARLVARQLAPHKRPKHYLEIGRWPRNAHGKLNRRVLADCAQAAIASIRPNTA